MPATRASIDISQLLTGTDCDVANEYNSMLDAANGLERKHRSVMEQAEKLKSIVQAKQAEIEQTTARHQAELADHIPRRKLSERLQGLGQKLKTSRREADRLREDLRHLHDDYAANQAELKSTKTALTAALDVDTARGLEAATAELHHTRRELQVAQQELQTLRRVRGDLEYAKRKLDLVAGLDCEICCDNNMKDRVLVCGHAYCSTCVEELGSGGQVKCPYCREEMSVRDVRKLFICRTM